MTQQSQYQDNAAWGNLTNTLVVDDSATMRDLISLTLRRQALEATVCDSGTDALNYCMLTTYDVVFLDIEMPEMSGFETARRMRELPGTNQTYIVAVTARAVTREFIQECTRAGINDCLVKPLQEDLLRKRLALWGRLKRQGALI